jgi:tetratricopeptide (TPR) repeat protein
MEGKQYRQWALILVCLLLLSGGPALAACEQKASQRVTILLQKVYKQIEADQPTAARQALEAFKDKYPDDGHYLIDYHLGNLYGQAGKLKKALAAYNAALEQCDSQAGLWQNRAKIAWDLKQYPLAANSLMRAYELNPKKDPTLLFQAAVARIYSDEHLTAAGILENLIDRAGKETQNQWLETYVNLTLEQRQCKRALQHTCRWRKHFEERPLYWRLQGLLHIHQKDYEKGASCLQVLAAFGPLQKSDKKLLADLLLQINVPLQAAELYEELLAADPKNRSLHELVITSYRLGLQPQKALQAIDRALAVHRCPKLLQNKGELLFEQGSYQQALKAFNETLAIDPKQGMAHLYCGYCAIRLEQKALARQALTKALRFKKQAKEARRLLAWLKASAA